MNVFEISTIDMIVMAFGGQTLQAMFELEKFSDYLPLN